jgi:hypothetical protein
VLIQSRYLDHPLLTILSALTAICVRSYVFFSALELFHIYRYFSIKARELYKDLFRDCSGTLTSRDYQNFEPETYEVA